MGSFTQTLKGLFKKRNKKPKPESEYSIAPQNQASSPITPPTESKLTNTTSNDPPVLPPIIPSSDKLGPGSSTTSLNRHIPPSHPLANGQRKIEGGAMPQTQAPVPPRIYNPTMMSASPTATTASGSGSAPFAAAAPVAAPTAFAAAAPLATSSTNSGTPTKSNREVVQQPLAVDTTDDTLNGEETSPTDVARPHTSAAQRLDPARNNSNDNTLTRSETPMTPVTPVHPSVSNALRRPSSIASTPTHQPASVLTPKSMSPTTPPKPLTPTTNEAQSASPAEQVKTGASTPPTEHTAETSPKSNDDDKMLALEDEVSAATPPKTGPSAPGMSATSGPLEDFPEGGDFH